MTERSAARKAMRGEGRTWAAAMAILVLTSGFALAWSHVKLFWVDELLEFYSDTRPSVHAVLAGQLRYPFSLEPPAFHLLLHGMDQLLSSSPEFASRLPSVVSLLLTQVCVFRITEKLTRSGRAALLAMTLPFLLATFDFAAEARVYSLLAALFAIALAAYQELLERKAGNRAGPLALLFSACAAAVLVHYYGLFLPLPFLAAEAAKAIRNRRVDWPVCLAVLISLAAFALNLPFFAGLADIREHYYGGTEAEAGWAMIPITYLWLAGQYNIYENNQYGNVLRFVVFFVTYVVLPAMVVVLSLRQLKRKTAIHPAFFGALLTGFFLPVVNILVAHYKTHAYVMRYSIPAVASLAVLIAWMLAPYLRSRGVFAFVLLAALGLACLQAAHDIAHDQEIRAKALDDEKITPDLVRARVTTADQHVYMQNAAKFLTTYFYAPADRKASIIGLGSIDRELFWLNRDPASLFLRNMHCSTTLPTMSLESLRTQPGPHLLVVFDDAKEEWIGMELDDRTRVSNVEPLGHAYGGRLLRVTFASQPESAASGAWECRSGEVR